MSANGDITVPTPRRSVRVQSRAGSVVSVGTTVAGTVTSAGGTTVVSAGGTRTRKRKAPLTSARTRKSNAYGSSGRVGNAEAVSANSTRFAKALQERAAGPLDQPNEETVDDDIDELADDPPVNGGFTSNTNRLEHIELDEGTSNHQPETLAELSPTPDYDSQHTPLTGSQTKTQPRRRMNYIQTPSIFSDEDLFSMGNSSKFSAGNISKSFGFDNEAGMATGAQRPDTIRSSSAQLPDLSPQRLADAQTVPKATTTDKRNDIENEVSALIAEERNRILFERGDEHPQPEPQQSQQSQQSQPEQQQQKQQQRPGQQAPRSIRDRVAAWVAQIAPVHGNAAPNHTENENDSENRNQQPLEWSKYIHYVKMAGCMILVTVVLFVTLPLMPAIFSSARTGTAEMGSAVVSRISHTWHGLTNWVRPGDGYDFSIPLGTSKDDALTIRALENTKKLRADVDYRFEIMTDAIRNIKDDLPNIVAVHRHADGKYTIPDEFWTALLDKAVAEKDSKKWHNFLELNRIRVDALEGVPVDATDGTRPSLITREELSNMMQKQYSNFNERIDAKLAKFVANQPRLSAQEMRATSLKTLALGNIEANYLNHIGQANYFSTGLDAFINPSLTSPTYGSKPEIKARLFQGFAETTRHPPIAALQSWEEAGDCWCAAAGEGSTGSAQLGVTLGYPVNPKRVTVEHLPKEMTPRDGKSGTAPRDMELWVKTDEIPSNYWNIDTEESKTCTSNGPVGYECLGRFHYDIHAYNHVQTFRLDRRISEPIKHTVLRVLDNHGGSKTCIYRVRLHGELEPTRV